MNFQDVKVLSYDHQNNFWGDSSFRYNSTVSISIKGYILNLSNAFGVSGVFEACKLLSDSLGSDQEIIINSINYGTGKIKSVSFDSGNWVKVTEYTISVEILKIGNLSDSLSGKTFENDVISSISSMAEYIEDFNESYSIDYSSNENSINGTHSIDVKISSLFVGDKILLAKNLASILYAKTFSEQISEMSYKKPQESLRKDFYSEDYDTINGKCGFKRNFSYSNDEECFSRQRSLSMELGEDGIVTVSESNSINGRCMQPNLFDSAEIGFLSEITGAFYRCSGMLENYKIDFAIKSGLIPDEINRSVKKNKFNGEIEYNISFANDPRRKGFYYHEYTIDLSRQEDFIWNISEAGSIRGSGRLGDEIKFNNALSGWRTESGSIFDRLSGFYNSDASIKPPNSFIKLTNKNIDFSPFDGLVNYNFLFTDDLNLNMLSDIRRTSISIEDSKPTILHNDFIIVGGASKYSVAQSTKSKQGEINAQCNFDICSSDVPFVANKYINSGYSIVTEKINDYFSTEYGGSLSSSFDGYIDSLSFSADEIEQTLNIDAKFKYSKKAV